MISHAPAGYRCPFCRDINDGISDYPLEIVHQNDDVFVKVNPKWWPNNPGAVLVIPNRHYENIYDLPDELALPIHRAARAAAIAMKEAFACDGVSTRQHNEPAGLQDVWHYHLHVFPRWHNDDLYALPGTFMPATDIAERAEQLRAAWPTDLDKQTRPADTGSRRA